MENRCRDNRRTKIVCTIGPASREPAVLEGMIAAGMDVVRLNFSHGTHDEHRVTIERVRELAGRRERAIAILQDLSGPKLRLGRIDGGSITLEPGAEFTLTTREVPGSAGEVSVDFSELPARVSPGDTMLLADGALELEVIGTTSSDIRCRVVVGGQLSSHKGINLPSGTLGLPGLTEKDRDDLRFGLACGVDLVALSFVRTAEDIAIARAFMDSAGTVVPIIAKIEKFEALQHREEIIAAADGIMIARGDLGVETPLERIALEQKELIRAANRAARPAITATQMLRSMVESPRPTRAEVADVANAILDGTDAVMLSEETAVGAYPVEAVGMMDRIAAETEKAFPYALWEGRVHGTDVIDTPEAVAHAACDLAEHIDARCIVCFTYSGSTARLVSKYRPDRPIIAPTPNRGTCRRLALIWGVEPWLTEHEVEGEELVTCAVRAARAICGAEPGDRLVITAGLPMGTPGGTNLIRAVVVEG